MMPQYSHLGYTVVGNISTNPAEWQLGPGAHFEINYLDRDGMERRLVVRDVTVMRSSPTELILSCLQDVAVRNSEFQTFSLELRFKYQAQKGKWSLILTVFGEAPQPKPKYQWLPRALFVWRTALTLIVGLMLTRYVSGAMSDVALVSAFFAYGVGLALPHGLAVMVLPNDSPDRRSLKVISWMGYVLASLATGVQVFLSLSIS